MVKESAAAANVIDLEAFRQRKLREERASGEAMSMAEGRPAALMVPVWFCWVPMWNPFVG